LLELQSPYGLLAFQQPLGSETILFQELFGLDNGEHFILSSIRCKKESGCSELGVDVSFGLELPPYQTSGSLPGLRAGPDTDLTELLVQFPDEALEGIGGLEP